MVSKETRLIIAIMLTFVFMVAEIIGGIYSNSLAILTDAAHLLTDMAGFGLALLATYISLYPATVKYTFGLARAEVIGALISVLSLWLMTGVLVMEATQRVIEYSNGNEQNIDGKLMFIIACAGVGVNVILAIVFVDEHGSGMFHNHSHDHEHNDEKNDHGAHNHGNGCTHTDEASHLLPTESNHPTPAIKDIETPPNGSDKNNDKIVYTIIQYKGFNPFSTICYNCSEQPKRFQSGKGSSSSYQVISKIGVPLVEEQTVINSYQNNRPGCGHDDSSSNHNHDHGHGHDHHEDAGHHDVPHHEEATDVNIQAAYLHVTTDLIQSVGVALAGLIIWMKPEWKIIDPICTYIFSILVLWSTISILKRIFGILFEGVPSHLNYTEIRGKLEAIPGVIEIHDLHIWSLSSQIPALTCHVIARDAQAVLKVAHKVCRESNIHHSTIQVQEYIEDGKCHSHLCQHNENDQQHPSTPIMQCL